MKFLQPLDSRLGRRTVLLFVLGGLLPLLALSIFGEYRFRVLTDERLRTEVAGAARAQGQAVLERLLLARQFAGARTAGEDSPPFARVIEVAPQQSPGAALLVETGEDTGRVLMRIGEDAASGRIVELNPEYLWRVATYLPDVMELCVLASNRRPLYCSADYARDFATRSASRMTGQSGTLLGEIDGERMVAAYWDLFLEAEFQVPAWTIVVVMDRAYAVAGIAKLQRLPAIALLLVAFAGLLVAGQLRSRLAPLSELTAATRDIGRRGFTRRVQIRSGDELEELGEAFNGMAERLARQFDRLQTLSELDRRILELRSIQAVVNLTLQRLPSFVDCRSALVAVSDFDDPCTLRTWFRAMDGDGSGVAQDTVTISEEQARWASGESGESGEDGLEDAIVAALLPADCRARAPAAGLLPLASKGKLLGFLVVCFDSEAALLAARADLPEVSQRLSVALGSFADEAALVHRAHFDELTGLPNRFLFMDRLGQVLEGAKREGRHAAVLFIDIDRFKAVNDSIGHAVGDLLLKVIGERIKAVLRSGETLARLGGDEFTVLLSLTQRSAVTQVAQRIAGAMQEPLELNGNRLYVSSSIGAAVYPDDGDTPEALLGSADAAMYRAKKAGGNQFVYFSAEMNRVARERLRLETEIQEALSEDAFELAIQPQFSLETGRILAGEVLLRWQLDGEDIPPDKFVPIAEETGQILALGDWVLRRTVAMLTGLQRRSEVPVRLAMNVSIRQIQLRSFAEAVAECLRSQHVPAECLEIELTETAIASDLPTVAENLRQLAELGCSITLDDFGTGYSSLRYLQQLPIHCLKLDRSFVRDIDHSMRERLLSAAIVDLADDLGKTVIAEGVETEAELHAVSKLGCSSVQGFLLSHPVSLREFEGLLDGDYIPPVLENTGVATLPLFRPSRQS